MNLLNLSRLYFHSTLLIISIAFCAAYSTSITPLNYTTDPLAAPELAVFEEGLVKTLKSIFGNVGKELLKKDQCIYVVEQYLKKYEKDNHSIRKLTEIKRSVAVVGNALLHYKMILRLMTLEEYSDVLEECKSEQGSLWESLQGSLARANLTFPTVEEDLKLALYGVLKLHYIYGLNATTQIRLGKFYGDNTKVYLSFQECFELAIEAMSYKAYALAYDWLEAGVKTMETSTDRTTLDKAWRQLMFKTNSSSFEMLQQKMQGKRQEDFPGLEKYNLYAGCRGEFNAASSKNSSLRCSYVNNQNPYLFIQPVKLEVLSENPRILQYHEVIESTDKFFDSHIFSRNFEMISGLVLSPIEFHYKISSPLGSRYGSHIVKSYGSSVCHAEKQKIQKLVVQLSGVPLGGNVIYPSLNLSVKTEKGSALVFFKGNEKNTVDSKLYQSIECPILFRISKVVTAKI